MKTALLLIPLMAISSSALPQPPAIRLQMSANLREALERSGFEDGIRTLGGPDLDRKLTSSAFGTSADAFVAGYYFEDELEGQRLGPLHISLFDRSRQEWRHKHSIHAETEQLGMMSGGSVVGIGVTAKLVLIDTHFSPSAGFTIVLDRSLNLVTSIGGFGTRVTDEGMIWYFGDMVHFADTHQETLKVYDVKEKTEAEIFPGPKLSPAATTYRRQIEALFAKIPDNQRDADFDRSIQSVVERDSTTFAFIVGYSSDYLEGAGIDHPTLMTVARCDRQQSGGQWSCVESELEQFARSVGTATSRDRYGSYDRRTLDALVNAALNRKP